MIKKYCLYWISSIFIASYLFSCTTPQYKVEDFEICGYIDGVRYYHRASSRIKICNIKNKKEYICTNSLDFSQYRFVYDSLSGNEDKKNPLYNPINSYQEFTTLKVKKINTITNKSGEMEVINYILKEINQTDFVNLNDTTNAVVKLLNLPELLNYVLYTDIIFSNTPLKWQKIINYYQSNPLQNTDERNNIILINHCKSANALLNTIKQNKDTNKVFYCLYLDNSKVKYAKNYYMDVFIELTQYKNNSGIIQFKKRLLNPESFFLGYFNLE